MPPKKTPPSSVTQNISGDNNIVVGGNVNGNVIVGDNNTVNQTIIQKFFNIFKSDAETVDQRNRRIMLGHVENFWVKGILEKSLHGAALLDLGIKEDPDALTYPWAIKRESNKETLPAGTSMLEIFQEIGIGRSLLILGAPGSGKTTMLLELTRQLIERAREDVTEPIPVVFNLSSWTEKLSLADWLASELNIIYTIPKKTAPTWVKENKMLLLLDGLDEVRQESRDKCVNMINQFRKENGLTSMAVCSRIQDYDELKMRLSFDGAIEIQHLTSNQVDDYFKRFGKGLTGIQQALEKDVVLREMAETPLFLSIMTLAYRDTQSKDILVINDIEAQRKHLFDTYIQRMFKRSTRTTNAPFSKQQTLHYLSWLAHKMFHHNIITYQIEVMQPDWLEGKFHHWLIGGDKIIMVEKLGWSWQGALQAMSYRFSNEQFEETAFLVAQQKKRKLFNRKPILMAFFLGLFTGLTFGLTVGASAGLIAGLITWLFSELFIGLGYGLRTKPISQTTYPGQRISLATRNSIFFFLGFAVIGVGLRLILVSTGWTNSEAFMIGSFFGIIGIFIGGIAVLKHFILRLILITNNLLPWRLIPFLDHCTDLIFLRRVGGGYIFVHRLLMEHFAAMYPINEK